MKAQRKFIHPGLTYTQADLDRMKAMIAAKQEPFYTTYQELVKSNYSQVGNGNYSDITAIAEGSFNGTIGADGRRTHDMALLYHLTGDTKYADDAVKRLNRYNNLTNASSRGTAPLDNGKIYLLIEAAELLRDYAGWNSADQAKFKKMLVYPFYSTKITAESYKSNTDASNNVSIYWNIYQFDPGRFGNQGLFAARGLMAMGIYLDNDTIYDRAYRYLAGLPARTDDLPYKPGPPTQGSRSDVSDYKYDYNVTWPSLSTRDNQYHSDEVLEYYIYQNGQCQESCRDQGHTMGGLGNYTAIAEIAWNQGDAMYSWLDNRILLGIEYNTRYNLSYVNSYPDQATPWEPTGASKNELDCTYENGVFYQAVSRSKRWEAIAISPQDRGSSVTGTGGWRTQVLQHYKIRAGLAAEDTKWLQRSYDDMMGRYGYENWGVSPNWYYEWCGWGTLTKFRTLWMAGDPGTWDNGKRVSGIPTVPCTIKAVDYDFYSEDGEGRTYHNVGTTKSTAYRTDGTIEIIQSGTDYVVSDMIAGEWMNYTLNAPAAGNYDIYVTYKATGESSLSFAVDNGTAGTGTLPGASNFTEIKVTGVDFPAGACVLRMSVAGSNALQVSDIRIKYASAGEKKVNFSGKLSQMNQFEMEWSFENILATDIKILRSASENVNIAEVILENSQFSEYTDASPKGNIPTYYYWVEYKENGTTYYSDPISFSWGYMYDDFKDADNILWTVSGQGSGTVENGVLNISYTSAKAYFKRDKYIAFHAGNYPLLAFCMDVPAGSGITLHYNSTNKFGGVADAYTGKIGDNVYYYDFTQGMFKTSATATTGYTVPTDSILTVNALQIRQTVTADTDPATKFYWAGTFKSLNELQEFASTNSINKIQAGNSWNYYTEGQCVRFSSLPDNAEVYAYTLDGRLITVEKSTGSSVSVILPGKGVYLLIVKLAEQTYSLKVII